MTDEGLPDVVMLVDPELALPEDAKITGGLPIMTVGGHFNGRWDSLHDLLARRREVERTLKANTSRDQRRITPPCCVTYEADTLDGKLLVFGEVIDPEMAYTMELMTGADRDEARKFKHRVANALGRGWLWGKWYSDVVPDGELGAVHRSQIGSVISRGAFDVAKASGWRRPWQRPGQSADADGNDGTAASGGSDDNDEKG